MQLQQIKKLPPVYRHTIILVVVAAVACMLGKSSLAQFDLQIFAILFLTLLILKRVPELANNHLSDSIILTFVIIFLINTSGAVLSPFFFLIYFLLFSLSLYLEPIITIVLSLSLLIFFVLNLPTDQGVKSIIPLLSLPLMTPFALFMGEEYIKLKRSRQKNIQTKEQTFLFLSLILKNHLKGLQDATENFMGDKQLHEIKKHTREIQKLIDDYEKNL